MWNEYRDWKKKKFMPIFPKLQKAHETGDYSEINYKTTEYCWIKSHKNKNSVYTYYPIAEIMWNEYQEWRKKNKK